MSAYYRPGAVPLFHKLSNLIYSHSKDGSRYYSPSQIKKMKIREVKRVVPGTQLISGRTKILAHNRCTTSVEWMNEWMNDAWEWGHKPADFWLSHVLTTNPHCSNSFQTTVLALWFSVISKQKYQFLFGKYKQFFLNCKGWE